MSRQRGRSRTDRVSLAKVAARYDAAERLAELVETGLEPWQHDHLGYFALGSGAEP